MRRARVFLLASALAAANALAPAHSADLASSPYGRLTNPAPAPGDEGTVYLRGAIGVDIGNTPDVAVAGAPVQSLTRPNSFAADVALGGSFAPDWRAELDVNPLFGSRIKYATPALSVAGAAYSAGFAMSSTIVPITVNLYRDFNTGTAFKPYIGAGAGLALSSTDLTTNLALGSASAGYKISSSLSTSFAAALMAGVAFEVSKNLTIDLGYKFLYVDEIKASKTFDTFTISSASKRNCFNEVLLGARYSFP